MYASYGDEFTRLAVWDGVSYDARWHYFALIAECCGSHRYDGRIPLSIARRASDVSDPDKCHAELERAGLLSVVADTVVMRYLEYHMPPPGQRQEHLRPRKRENQRAWRRRECEAGRHTRWCPPDICPRKRNDRDP
jgi:hypothetical protein